MSLTIEQLFTPAASGVGLNPNVPAPPGTWLALLLESAQILGLPTTSWQPGAPERTILALAAVALAQEDVTISLMAQGGFLDFAASGTVQTVGLNGVITTQPVTPDPSIPSQNPDGNPGWLDALGTSVYDVERLKATAATGPLAVVNVGAFAASFAAGAYHVANTGTGKPYSNVLAVTFPPSAIAGTGGVVTAIAIGATTTITTQSAHGLAIGDVVYFLGIIGVNGLNGVFASVTGSASPTTFTVQVSTSGTWTSGGQVYKCSIATMAADSNGTASNAAAGQVTSPITQQGGVSIFNLVPWSAANFESNVNYANRCRLKLGALSPNGPRAAYEYFALSAQGILAAQVPAITLRNGPIAKTLVISNPQNDLIYVIVASSSPASTTLGQPVTPGCAQLPIGDASNATPIEITTVGTHGLVTGDAVVIGGVIGNTAANGAFFITVTGASTFKLDGSVGSGSYLSGGQVDGGDLGQVDNLIQQNVVPDGNDAQTKSALAFPVVVVATVVVPQAYLATYQVAAPLALQALFASFPIGGNIPPPPATAGTIPISAVEGALIDAGVIVAGAVSYVRQVSGLTINGSAIDLVYPSPYYEAQVVTPAIVVIGV